MSDTDAFSATRTGTNIHAGTAASVAALIDPRDSLEQQNRKLLRVIASLIHRAENSHDPTGLAYAQFERAALLEVKVRERTLDMERAIDLLNDSNARLAEANTATEAAWSNLAEATEAIRDGLALFDRDGRLVLFNSRFCAELHDVVELLKPGLMFRDYLRMVSRSRYRAQAENQSAGDWLRWRLDRHGEIGAVFNVGLVGDRVMQVSSRRTATGATVIMHTDVTDILRHERQERDKLVSQQAALLRATLDHLNQGVCIFDHDGKLVGWNRRLDALLALPGGHGLLGMGFGTLIDRLGKQIEFPDNFSTARLREWATRHSGRLPIVFEVRRKARTILSVFGQEMPDHGFVLSFTDVTAEREAANAMSEMNVVLERRVTERTIELGEALTEAERANASKSRFVAAASHDLLQPLSAAKLFVSSLADHLRDAAALDVVDKAETSLAAAEQIIEALLDISRLDSRQATFERRPVPLGMLFGALAAELRPEAAAKGLKFSVVDTSLMVESDPGYLRRILQNLITNALRYTDRGRVLVGVRRNGESARIEVWDTGRGIGAQEQEIIFQEFRQLNREGAGASGLGLGLAIVERACAALNHPLQVWSETGVGSCFSFSVPILDQFTAPPGSPGERQAHQAPNACDGLVVLLVENNQQLRRALSMQMEIWGCVVLSVAGAAEAIRLMREIDMAPEALILDYRLGDGMTGLDVYHQAQALLPGVAARIVTADRSRQVRQLCAQSGLGIISKPVDRAKLLDFLNQVAIEALQQR